MLNSFWNWFVIIITVASILGCWWLLHWTKGVSDRSGDDVGSTGHVWDEDLKELNTPLPRWWLHLFNITIVFAIAYLVLFPGLGNFAGVLGWTQEEQYEEEMAAAEVAQQAIYARYSEMSPEALKADAAAMGTAGRLFRQNCAMCHGSDGRGARWVAVLGEDGTQEVVQYVLQLSGQDADPQLASAGQARFQTVCMACHGMDGKGNQALGAPNLTDDIWLYGGDASDIEYALRNGLNGVMPAFGESLSEERRRLLSAYVQAMSDS